MESVKVGATTLTVKRRAPRWTQDQIKILLTAAIDQRETLMGKFRGHSSGHSGAEKDKVYEEIGLKVSANSITQRDGRACADKLRCFTSECKNKWVLLVEKHNKTGSGGPPDPKEYLHELDVLGLEYLGGTNIEGVQYQEATAMSDEDEEEVTQQILAVERTLQGNESPMTDTVPGPGSMGKRRLFDGAQRIKITESLIKSEDKDMGMVPTPVRCPMKRLFNPSPNAPRSKRGLASSSNTNQELFSTLLAKTEEHTSELKSLNANISEMVSFMRDFVTHKVPAPGQSGDPDVKNVARDIGDTIILSDSNEDEATVGDVEDNVNNGIVGDSSEGGTQTKQVMGITESKRVKRTPRGPSPVNTIVSAVSSKEMVKSTTKEKDGSRMTLRDEILQAIDELLADVSEEQMKEWIEIAETRGRSVHVHTAERRTLTVFDALDDDTGTYIMKYVTRQMPPLSTVIASNKMMSLIIGELVVTEAILVNPEIPTTPKKKDQTGEGPEGGESAVKEGKGKTRGKRAPEHPNPTTTVNKKAAVRQLRARKI